MKTHVGIANTHTDSSINILQGRKSHACTVTAAKSEEGVTTAETSSAESLFIYCMAVEPILALLQELLVWRQRGWDRRGGGGDQSGKASAIYSMQQK